MLITLTGPTGSGKTTLAQTLVQEGVGLVPTWTTRSLRKGESGRGDIAQVSKATLLSSTMLEIAEYDNHWYGTPWNRDVSAALAGETNVVKILEPQGLAAAAHRLSLTAPTGRGNSHSVAHVYIDVDANTACRRLMARCGGLPSSADQRRLDRAPQECREWRSLMNWSHIIDNSKDNVSMTIHAQELLTALGLSIDARAIESFVPSPGV